jgi:geranylgeranyl pyrophosphate synthase
MDTLSNTIRSDLISIDHPVLNQVASYFFGGANTSSGGKKIRPMMILLLSKAMQIHDAPAYDQGRPDIHAATRRLAEISELIHTASLFHDDVIDGADTRRGTPTVHKVFGNKMAILAGDYLLARASIFLARLRNVEVVESMSTIIEHLVRGEVMQLNKATLTTTPTPSTVDSSTSFTPVHHLEQRMVYYLRKNFYKTASLMANSCKSAAILGGYPDDMIHSAYCFGKHLGIAFQLVDDVLDYEGTVGSMGKPPLADLNAGLATAPVLLASHVLPELIPMMDRKFRLEGDVDRAVYMVRQTNAIQRTMELAVIHAQKAMDSIMPLKPSVYRDSLVHLAHSVVNRSR